MAERLRLAADLPTAPAPLDMVQAFVNTRLITADNPYAREDLSSPAALDAWWAERDPDVSLNSTDDDLELAIAVREGLRGSLARHGPAGTDVDAAALDRLEAVTAKLPLRATFEPGQGPVIALAAGSTAHALAGLLARTVQGRIDGTWTRLKVCRDPACRAAFYDTSKNRSGTWCSMRLCGARAKQRTYVTRRREQQRR
jgi:predicted RNA-binding Zn ribbon-like protein